ncbi:MAG: hypothetical protein DRP74_02825 [Candidatus Omnitrophota bacterium]|nr:MAG: hypothetical protein DRP74_02825 [Candidatus Omnitrophota bacterium]
MLELRQIIPRGLCLDCRGCCRFLKARSIWAPRLLSEEKKSLYLKKKKFALFRDSNTGYFFCGYLNQDNNKCRIYKKRPFDCRLYPFLLSREGNKIFLAADLNCPFIAENLKKQKLKRHILYLKAFFNRPKVRSLLQKNPQFIQRYKGALHLLELKI